MGKEDCRGARKRRGLEEMTPSWLRPTIKPQHRPGNSAQRSAVDGSLDASTTA